MKKIISLLLTLIMLFSLISFALPTGLAATEYTYGDYTFTVSGSNATITSYPETASGTADIPSTINSYTVTAIAAYSFYGCTLLTEVKIPNTVTLIGNYAFGYCTSLTSVEIPPSVSKIGANAFKNSNKVSIVCESGSYAEQYANEQGIPSTGKKGTIEFAKSEYECGVGEEFPISGTYTSDGVAHDLTFSWTVEGASIDSLLNRPGSVINNALENVYYFSIKAKFSVSGTFKVTIKASDGATATCTVKVEASENVNFINQHLKHAKTNKDINICTLGFFNSCFSNESDLARRNKLVASKVQHGLTASKEFLSLNWNFKGYDININFYDVFIADTIINMAQSNYATQNMPTWIKCVEEALKLWKLKIDPKGQVLEDEDWEVIKAVCSGVKDKITGVTQEKLSSLLNDRISAIKADKELGACFKTIDKVGKVLKVASSLLNTYNCVVNAMKLHAVVKYIQNMSLETFDVLDAAAIELNKMGEEDSPKKPWEFFNLAKLSWSNTLKDYSKWFKESLNDYKAVAKGETSMDSEITEGMIWGIAESIWNALPFADTIIHGVVDLGSRFVARHTALAAADLATSINSVLFTWKATIAATDILFGNSEAAKSYEKVNYTAFIEWPLSNLHNVYAEKLINNPTLENAQAYDYYFTLLKSVEQVCNGYFESYCSTDAPLAIKNRELFARAAEEANEEIYRWKNNRVCHDADSLVYSGDWVKTLAVCCPVDVLVKNRLGETVLSIVNDEIKVCKDSVVANASNRIKVFTVPNSEEYTVTITPYNSGSMDCFVSEGNGVSEPRCVEFYDISITKGNKLTGSVSSTVGHTYSLKRGGKTITPSYDSKTATKCTKGHTVSQWNTIRKATCSEIGINRGTCKYCGYIDFEYVDKTDHVDKNNDGICDECNAEIEQSAGSCPYCHQIHTGFFGKIVAFFHKLLYRLTHLFG